jgi:peptidoglycan/LPS O-acetylase OafA/YrhL
MSNKFYWLDLLRGLSAIAVFAGHLRSFFFLDYGEIQPNILAKIFYFLTGFGHQSVIIFFVLSGFFIAKTIEEAVEKQKWSFKTYFINRFLRLELVLIPALFLGLFWDTFGLLYYPQSAGYLGHISAMQEATPVGRLGTSVFFGNIFFLQTILTPTFGSNAPLWSLANEFWYYMIFPFLYFSLTKHFSILIRLFCILIAFLLLFLIGYRIAIYFLIWLIGAAIFHFRNAYSKKYVIDILQLNKTLKIVFFIFLFTLFFIRNNIEYPQFNDAILSIISGVFILLLSYKKMDNIALKNTTNYLSNISYTLYLTHIPIALFLCSVIANNRNDWNAQNLLIYAFLFLIILLYATLSWYLFERNTALVKKWFFPKKSIIKLENTVECNEIPHTCGEGPIRQKTILNE